MQHSAHLVQVDDLHAACVGSITDKAKQAVNHCVSSRDQLLFEALAVDLIQACNSKKQCSFSKAVPLPCYLHSSTQMQCCSTKQDSCCWEQHLTGADTVCADQLDGLLRCPQPLHLSIKHGQVGHLQASSSCARKGTIHQQQAITMSYDKSDCFQGVIEFKASAMLTRSKAVGLPCRVHLQQMQEGLEQRCQLLWCAGVGLQDAQQLLQMRKIGSSICQG